MNLPTRKYSAQVCFLMAALFAVLVVFTIPAAAQLTSGDVVGTVLDPTGAALPGSKTFWQVVGKPDARVPLPASMPDGQDGSGNFALPPVCCQANFWDSKFLRFKTSNLAVAVAVRVPRRKFFHLFSGEPFASVAEPVGSVGISPLCCPHFPQASSALSNRLSWPGPPALARHVGRFWRAHPWRFWRASKPGGARSRWWPPRMILDDNGEERPNG